MVRGHATRAAGGIGLGVALLGGGGVAHAQQPRVGIVLSGGAAKGLAHIGVLQVLEEAGIQPAVITGTSMGALVGGLYAVGYGADSLAAVARAIDWGLVLSDRIARRHRLPEQKLRDGRHLLSLPLRGYTPQLPAQLVPAHNVRQMLARLTWSAALVRDFRALAIPFAAVAADLETGAPIVFTSGPLVDALTASMAIPGVFAPVHIGERTLWDGGMARNLPAQDALALGADVLICSDVTEPLKPAEDITSVLDVVTQALFVSSAAAHEEERARCDVLIEPDIEGITAFDFGAVADWIARGRAAAAAAQARLDSLGRATASEAPRRVAAAVGARQIATLETVGTDSAHSRLVRRRLGLALPGRYDARAVAEALDRLYATREFERVSYTLEAGADSSARLVVRAEGHGPSTVGFGLRYEGAYKASLLFSASLFDRVGLGSLTTIDVRLGEQASVVGAYQRRIGPLRPWALSLRAGYDRVPVDRYEDGSRTAQGRFYLFGASLLLGAASGTSTIGGLVIRGEHARSALTTGAEPNTTPTEDRWLATVGAALRVDTRDAPRFPRAGLLVEARGDWTDRALGSESRFSQQVARVEAALPALRQVSVLLRAEVGMSSGPDLPAHYRFYLGGAVPYYVLPDRHRPFLGLRVQERSGRYYQVVGAGVQLSLPAHILGLVQWNAGEVNESGTLQPDAWLHGVGATLAMPTALGTIALHLSSAALDGPYRFEFDVGFAF